MQMTKDYTVCKVCPHLSVCVWEGGGTVQCVKCVSICQCVCCVCVDLKCVKCDNVCDCVYV